MTARVRKWALTAIATPAFLAVFATVWLEHVIRAVPEAWDQAYRMVLK
jgi:hypothetical protein